MQNGFSGIDNFRFLQTLLRFRPFPGRLIAVPAFYNRAS
jgi:hypothetical protein